jgi:hypothetical protein
MTLEDFVKQVEDEHRPEFERQVAREARRRFADYNFQQQRRKADKKRKAEAEGQRSTYAATARRVLRGRYGAALAEKVDPLATYDLLKLTLGPRTVFAAFSSSLRAAEARNVAAPAGLLPEPAGAGVWGGELAKRIPAGALLGVDIADEALRAAALAEREKADAKRRKETQAEAARQQEQAQQRENERLYGVPVT